MQKVRGIGGREEGEREGRGGGGRRGSEGGGRRRGGKGMEKGQKHHATMR